MTAPLEPSPDGLRVFVDGHGVTVPRGATALDAVRACDAELAALLAAGARTITDSRGLPLEPHAPAYAGAIYRLVSARRAADDDDPTA